MSYIKPQQSWTTQLNYILAAFSFSWTWSEWLTEWNIPYHRKRSTGQLDVEKKWKFSKKKCNLFFWLIYLLWYGYYWYYQKFEYFVVKLSIWHFLWDIRLFLYQSLPTDKKIIEVTRIEPFSALELRIKLFKVAPFCTFLHHITSL